MKVRHLDSESEKTVGRAVNSAPPIKRDTGFNPVIKARDWTGKLYCFRTIKRDIYERKRRCRYSKIDRICFGLVLQLTCDYSEKLNWVESSLPLEFLRDIARTSRVRDITFSRACYRKGFNRLSAMKCDSAAMYLRIKQILFQPRYFIQ